MTAEPENPNTVSAFMQTVERPAHVMLRGEGSFLWDESGKKYLDFVQGWAVNALGHCAPEVVAAIERQARTLITPSPAYYNENALELAKRLTALTGLAQAYFGVTGADANEAAFKLARKWGRIHKAGAFEILSTSDSFHGRTLATMAASGKPGFDALFPPNMPGFRKVGFGDIGAVREAISAQTVAIVVEPIQGEGGVIVPPSGYLRALRTLADEHDLLLIVDEVQTGVYRTGTFVACEAEGVQPDMLTLGKGLGGGLPISALLAHSRAGTFGYGEQGGTFHNNPFTAAAALAVLSVVESPEFLRQIGERAAELSLALSELAVKHAASVRGRGFLWAIELPLPIAAEVRDACFEAGLLVNAARPNAIRLMPSLRTSSAEIQQACRTLDAAITGASKDVSLE